MGIEWDLSDLRLTEFRAKVESNIPKALLAGIEVIHAAANPNVPIGETQKLVGSGETKVDGMTASLTYPGPYSRYQEFGVYYRHGKFGAPLTHTSGKSFYLTSALWTAKNGAKEMLAQTLFEGL